MVADMIQRVEAPIKARGNPDVLVVGAGIFGLWAARHAILAKRKVLVLDKRHAGAGASGGFVGALMPHMPDRWNLKKQAQFDALVSLPQAIAALEADTGISCGYRRCGRLVPLVHERACDALRARSEGAAQHWPGFRLEHLASLKGTGLGAWLDERAAPFGVQFDDLSARVDPRALIASLAAFVRAHGELREGVAVTGLASRAVILGDGSRLEAGEVIIANGFEAYPLLQPYLGRATGGAPIGRGVKGQAMLLSQAHDDLWPVLYHDGVYAVPHSGGRVAIGSTSRDDWSGEPDAFEDGDTGFHDQAMRLAPVLRNSAVIGQWAGVRPRNMLKPHDTEAWSGAVPGLDGVSARIGGFKTGFAMAHV
jgi:glycine/D-amino acid oxidase-like deaminating enzyme